MGFYHMALSPANLITTWFIGLLFCLLIGFKLSKFSLIKNMIKGQLKTEALIKEAFYNLKWICLGVYIVVYCLMSMFATAGMESNTNDDNFFVFTGVALLSQFAAYLMTTLIVTFMANMEFERLGMACVFNLLVDTFFDDTKKDVHHEG
jgi:ABC-type enterochelin transport system permease subunit